MTVLITGGSRGIGFELARVFAENGYDLFLTAKDPEKLERAAEQLQKEFEVEISYLAKDLSEDGAAEEIYEETGEINILVNNAGFGVSGQFSETPLQEELDMIDVNVISPTVLTKKFLRDNPEGRILNVASTAAFQPGPYMAAYYATKSYILSFSQAIGAEGASVTTLCPGPTDTGFFEKDTVKEENAVTEHMMEPKKVAREGYRGLMKQKNIVIPGYRNKFFYYLSKFLPNKLTLRFVKRIQSD